MEKAKSEDRIQSDIFLHFWNKYPQLRRTFFHVPNGGKRGKREASKFKAMGVVPGIPDMVFCIARKGHHGLFVELKRKGERVRQGSNQEAAKGALIDQGYLVKEFDDPNEAITFIEGYINS